MNEKRELGHSGILTSALGLGCWAIGGGNWGDNDDSVSVATIRRAVELGIKLSILGAGTRNVDGKAFGAMLVSLPEEEEKRKAVLDYLNGHEGVTAEVIQ